MKSRYFRYMIMVIIQIKGFKCGDVCSHEWISRNRESQELPIAYTKCKSPYWNKSARKQQQKGTTKK